MAGGASVREEQGFPSAEIIWRGGGGHWGSIAGAGRSWCGLWPAMIAMVSGKHPPGASSLLCTRGHDGAGSERRGEPGVTQPERSPAWLCIHCDKAEWFFGPEPLARLSAHHAPFPSLVTPGRHPFLPGGGGAGRMQGSRDAPRAVGCWDLCISPCFWGIPGVWGAWGLCTLRLVLCSQRQMRAAEEKEGSSGHGPFLVCCLL